MTLDKELWHQGGNLGEGGKCYGVLSFRDLKNLLDLEKLMNQKRGPLEQIVPAPVLLVGEAVWAALGRGKSTALYSGLCSAC